MKKDELFDIFRRKLSHLDPEVNCSEELISETVEEYVERLLLRAHIPIHFVESIEKDLVEEVTEMYRKKTYGFLDIKSYLRVQRARIKQS